MMNTIVNIIVTDTKAIPKELMALEVETVNNWKKEGLLDHLFMKKDGSGVFLIFGNVDEKKVKELIFTLPLYKHIEKVEYFIVDKSF